jgi:hypothetical protein
LDVAQVHQLWDDLARDPLADPATAEWLKRRETLADHWQMLGFVRDHAGYPPDLARAIRPDTRALPPWAIFGRSWAESGHRLVFPCFDAVGELVALRARYVGHASDVSKEVSPRGPGATRGTVYADWMARAVLQTENAKPGELADPTGRRWDGRVLVLEGGAAWLRYCLDHGRWALRPGFTEDLERIIPDHWHGPAMVGVWSGAWPAGPLGEQLAERFKHATAVIVATDDDKDGDKYEAAIRKTCKAIGVLVGRTNKNKRDSMSGTGPDDRQYSVQELLKEGEENATQAEAGPWAKVVNAPSLWLTERPPEPRWLLKDLNRPADGFLRMGKVGILAAPGGTGKSWALVALALAVATGREWLSAGGAEPVRGFPVATPGRVALLMGEEDAEEVGRRLYWAGQLMGLSREELDGAAENLFVGPLAGEALALVDENGNLTERAGMLRQRLAVVRSGLSPKSDSAEPAEWSAILIDPLSRFAGIGAETDNAHATRAIQALEALTKLPGNPAVLVAHHERKSGGQGAAAIRGSSAIVDGARWAGRLVGLEKPPTQGQGKKSPHAERWRTPTGHLAVRLRSPKANYTGPLSTPMLVLDGEFKGALRLATASEEAAWKAATSDTPTDTPAPVSRRPRVQRP